MDLMRFCCWFVELGLNGFAAPAVDLSRGCLLPRSRGPVLDWFFGGLGLRFYRDC